MKLTVIGGGGIRSPLLVSSMLRRSERINLEEICLMDIDADKLDIIGRLCQELAKKAGASVQITTTTDARAAVRDARYIVMTIRVGAEGGRVLDERIALKHGILGQETTGPGGFAMALRSIPAILGYAKLIQEISPDAWIFNFTNPAGLVMQALCDSGYSRVVGICDSANLAQHAVADWMGLPADQVRAETYGLNHLSWTRRVLVNGKDVLPPLLLNPEFLSKYELNVFEPELVERMGVWLNEYLYYYYYAERAVESISNAEQTRGEEIMQLNQLLLNQLRTVDIEKNPDEAFDLYFNYNRRRRSTYMHYARTDAGTKKEPSRKAEERITGKPDSNGDGYAGVALSLIEAFESNQSLHIALNTTNDGAINCMRSEDVVEVSCTVGKDGIHALPIGDVPENHELLMRMVKYYERLTVKAIFNCSRDIAVMALMSHPLVLSYSRAKILVDEYLEAHAPYIGDWH